MVSAAPQPRAEAAPGSWKPARFWGNGMSGEELASGAGCSLCFPKVSKEEAEKATDWLFKKMTSEKEKSEPQLKGQK